MPIILAIEPDRRQRDALAAVVRKRVGAELIIADTTERALEAIGNRVPDLVLVPALLSPSDDAALAAALRVIAAAAHVRTLTIPVLAAHAVAAPSSGILSRWRRGKSASQAMDGCDPAVFADQIASYLKESAAERALMVDDLDDELPVSEPAYAQEFGREDGQADANAYVQDAQAYVRADEQPYQTDVQEFDQPGAQTYAQQDAQTYTQPDVAYTQPDIAYAQPDVAYVQADVAYVQRDVQAYVQTDAPTYSQPDPHTYARPDEQAYAQNEVLDIVERDGYDAERADGDGLSARQLDQEEDIDLSNELDELDPEESGGRRSETSETELFDGEEVGVYTMSFGIDEPDVDVAVLDARKAFAEVEAAVEPAFDAKAFAESEFEAEAAVDPEFFTESFEEPAFETETRTESDLEAEADAVRAFEADANPEDAEPWPSDAEPWVSASLSPRGGWPAMEGVPTELPSAFAAAAVEVPVPVAVVAAAAPVVEARPAPAPHKSNRPEWSELVASLRKDIERRRVEPPQEKPKPSASASAPVPAPRRSKQPKPVQDEWGFFDPEQCGFAALLAKLDEITETVEDTEVHQAK